MERSVIFIVVCPPAAQRGGSFVCLTTADVTRALRSSPQLYKSSPPQLYKSSPPQLYKSSPPQILSPQLSGTHSPEPTAAPAAQRRNSSSESWRATLGAERRLKRRDLEKTHTHTHTHTDEMSSYVSSECRRVSPSVHGNKFDTAHRKKAAANIFESVNQDALMRLFQKTGDMKAEERVRSIFSYTQDPEETARALMALKQRKKDKFLQIAGMLRQLLKMR
ncbi:hypothetical protein L3Q82_006715 [Scortum barcoo]|uniref:Uncharacterized protein n=1 Tax=Scortum barcoo TaxID=214431 RepID=A0ACB8WVN5_9TELE|nr:hypothetical protein L3Q82_006715 [Scortum barcoo]